jgi:outer membrane murein-binding lipoprotein Lpp
MAPWWNRELGNPRASLGCGTLILIGIIVAICSGGLRSNIDQLRNDIQKLEQKVDALAEAAKPAAAAPAEAIQLP